MHVTACCNVHVSALTCCNLFNADVSDDEDEDVLFVDAGEEAAAFAATEIDGSFVAPEMDLSGATVRNTSDVNLFANGAHMFTHKELVEKAASGPGQDDHVAGPCRWFTDSCPWFSLIDGLNDPVAHSLVHGICEGVLSLVFGPPGKGRECKDWVVPNHMRDPLDRQMEKILTVSDVSRPPRKVSTARGWWTMDDCAWFFGLYMPLIRLDRCVKADWMKTVLCGLHTVILHVWFGYFPGKTFAQSSDHCAKLMWDLAVELEKHGQVGLLTTNMHACAVHMLVSERRSGPLYRRKEVYNERFIGDIKDGVTGRISASPEKVQARQWYLKEGTYTRRCEYTHTFIYQYIVAKNMYVC